MHVDALPETTTSIPIPTPTSSSTPTDSTSTMHVDALPETTTSIPNTMPTPTSSSTPTDSTSTMHVDALPETTTSIPNTMPTPTSSSTPTDSTSTMHVDALPETTTSIPNTIPTPTSSSTPTDSTSTMHVDALPETTTSIPNTMPTPTSSSTPTDSTSTMHVDSLPETTTSIPNTMPTPTSSSTPIDSTSTIPAHSLLATYNDKPSLIPIRTSSPTSTNSKVSTPTPDCSLLKPSTPIPSLLHTPPSKSTPLTITAAIFTPGRLLPVTPASIANANATRIVTAASKTTVNIDTSIRKSSTLNRNAPSFNPNAIFKLASVSPPKPTLSPAALSERQMNKQIDRIAWIASAVSLTDTRPAYPAIQRCSSIRPRVNACVSYSRTAIPSSSAVHVPRRPVVISYPGEVFYATPNDSAVPRLNSSLNSSGSMISSPVADQPGSDTMLPRPVNTVLTPSNSPVRSSPNTSVPRYPSFIAIPKGSCLTTSLSALSPRPTNDAQTPNSLFGSGPIQSTQNSPSTPNLDVYSSNVTCYPTVSTMPAPIVFHGRKSRAVTITPDLSDPAPRKGVAIMCPSPTSPAPAPLTTRPIQQRSLITINARLSSINNPQKTGNETTTITDTGTATTAANTDTPIATLTPSSKLTASWYTNTVIKEFSPRKNYVQIEAAILANANKESGDKCGIVGKSTRTRHTHTPTPTHPHPHTHTHTLINTDN